MISILIPVYNYDVTKLVKELHHQAVAANIVFEIILLDDCSSKYKATNSILQKFEHIHYQELKENIGRSRIRNRLAEIAKYENLIFLDCDSELSHADFVLNYYSQSAQNIVCGGTLYAQKAPSDKKYFHWYYGKMREALSLEQRKENPNRSFKTNNFMIKKSIFEKIKFDENLKKYGHEDTLFGYELKKNGIEITHIQNPVIHAGLEDYDVFIAKTKNSLENLIYLLKTKQNEKKLFEDIRVLNYFFPLKKWHLTWFMKLFYFLTNKVIYRLLQKKNPNLYFFDIYKLGFLCCKF